MKAFKYILIIMMTIGFVSCTSDFTEINTNPNDISTEEASAKYFLTGVQFKLYGPDRYPYWRAQLIHADRYAGHFTFGFNGSWWADDLGYTYNPGYTDAAWDWLAGFFGGLDNFMSLTEPGGDFENEKMHAVGQIIKGLYFQMFTDTFGQIPYSQTGDEDILTPAFDDQITIYKGVIDELDEAMATIGDATVTGEGIEDLGANDLYCNGDLQKWKKLANTLKLRMALRAHGAPGDDFSDAAIAEALNAPLLDATSGDVLLEKDREISQWASAAYGDVWHNFGGFGSKWKVSKTLLDYLKDYEDPRLSLYAKPAPGGEVKWDGSTADEEVKKRMDYIVQTLQDAGAEPVVETFADSMKVSIAKNTYYIGQPVRLNGFIYDFVSQPFFSDPADVITNPKGSDEIFPEIIMTVAESYFLQAEAAIKGFGGGDAQELFSMGIEAAMQLWGVSGGDIGAYLNNSDLAMLNGSEEENLEKIAIQRWIAAYTDGFEAWAVVRDTGYPASLAAGVNDSDIFAFGDINGAYPMRMQYGNAVKSENAINYEAAVADQGPDKQDVKLWWAR